MGYSYCNCNKKRCNTMKLTGRYEIVEEKEYSKGRSQEVQIANLHQSRNNKSFICIKLAHSWICKIPPNNIEFLTLA